MFKVQYLQRLAFRYYNINLFAIKSVKTDYLAGYIQYYGCEKLYSCLHASKLNLNFLYFKVNI